MVALKITFVHFCPAALATILSDQSDPQVLINQKRATRVEYSRAVSCSGNAALMGATQRGRLDKAVHLVITVKYKVIQQQWIQLNNYYCLTE